MTTTQDTSTTAAAAAVDHVAEEIQNRVGPWLRTREGVASASVAAVVFFALWGPVDAPVLSDVLCAAFAIVLVSLAARLWESRTAPHAPAFSVIRGPVDGSVDVQNDENAGFWRDKRGFLWADRVWFAGTGCPPCLLRPDTYLRLRAWRDQSDLPVFVARARERQWWWWRDAFYWDSGDYGPEDLGALLLMLEDDDEQGIEWEFDLHLPSPIPEDVKRLVFERDRGRCLACGSDELIQYDHVVPSSMGGGNEPENIRLLCAGCNRR
jgi:HNH endonuclease